MPKTAHAAILMEVSVPNLLSCVRVLGRGSLELCQLGAEPTLWEQRWETICMGIFQIIGLPTQYHLDRRYLLNSEMPVLHRVVPDGYSLRVWSIFFFLVFFGFSIFSFFVVVYLMCEEVVCSCYKSSTLILRFSIKSRPLFYSFMGKKSQSNKTVP